MGRWGGQGPRWGQTSTLWGSGAEGLTPQVWWDSYVVRIRDQIVRMLSLANDTYNLGVGEVMAGLWPSLDRFARSGLYVLPPSQQPAFGRPQPTEAYEESLRFKVFVLHKSWTEPDHLDRLGRMCSLVVDAIRQDPLLNGLCEGSWIVSVAEPTIVFGTSTASAVAHTTVTIEVVKTQTALGD